LEGSPADRQKYASLYLRDRPPQIRSATWINSPPLDLADLKGKAVLLDFWGTWSAPCIAAVPRTNALLEKYGDQGLMIIGVCTPRDVDRMAEVVAAENIRYAVCADTDGAINRAYRVNSYPDYMLIDRNGKLRIADCRSEFLDEAIEMLLAEPAVEDN
jgi:thiol-disulfide isomerase/thioredoxin